MKVTNVTSNIIYLFVDIFLVWGGLLTWLAIYVATIHK